MAGELFRAQLLSSPTRVPPFGAPGGPALLLSANGTHDQTGTVVQAVGSDRRYGLSVHDDLGQVLWLDGLLPHGLDLRAAAASNAHGGDDPEEYRVLAFVNRSDLTISGTPADALETSAWFDDASSIVADWRRRELFWCQPSERRILYARMAGSPEMSGTRDGRRGPVPPARVELAPSARSRARSLLLRRL